MKWKKALVKMSVVTACLLWLTPTYICAMEDGSCPLMKSLSQSQSKHCQSDCCQTEKNSSKRTPPCQTNSTCGTLQSAVTSQPFFVVPNSDAQFTILLPVDHATVSGLLNASADSFRPPARGHPARSFVSNFSSLSPPLLS